MDNKPTASHEHTQAFLDVIKNKHPHENEFQQAVQEVMEDVIPWIDDNPRYQIAGLLEHITLPDRVIEFKVAWEDDAGILQHNIGYRVQSNGVLGPYKGGLRFAPTVNLSVLKFLGFEQIFKNSLTGLPLGAGKGGSDFDPKGKSDREIKRFCQAFIDALSPFIGDDKDVPAGDMGVGPREIGYMFGQLQRSQSHGPGVLTGKGQHYGGSHLRPEATGYGCVYFLQHMLTQQDSTVEGKNVLISGAGNVALYAAEKCLELGAKVITLSDSQGVLHIPNGLSKAQLNEIMHARLQQHKRLSSLSITGCTYTHDKTPWDIPGEIALPSATQNELHTEHALTLCKNGLKAVAEGANMPSTPGAIRIMKEHNILFGPGKAANAGGVAVSGLEMAQNAMGYFWNSQEVDQKLQEIMHNIHSACLRYGATDPQSHPDYAKGANIAGFIRIADALIDLGYC